MLQLHGLGHFHPENIVDNAFLEALDIGTTEDWIMSRVGIRERRTILPLDYLRETKNRDPRATAEAATYTDAETGAKAANMALERAGLQHSDIGLVIAGGCCPQWQIPAMGSAVANQLNIDCPAFDLHSACSTFGAQLHTVAQMGDSLPDYVLCLQVENVTRVIDFGDRSSAILFGDASTAAIVSPRQPGKAQLLQSIFGGAPSGAMDVVIPRAGHFFQNGSKVQKFAIKKMTELYRGAQAKALALNHHGPVAYVGHQANLTMLRSVQKRCEIPDDLHWYNIDRFGNQGAAGSPAVLSSRWDSYKKDDLVASVVVGSGLSWSSLLWRFNNPSS
jgi:3-oxoacyl-[acyl-carrier-protein] synthase III